MPIRPANSVTIIQRRLTQAESSPVEPVELVSLHDELARVERKWLMQLAEGSERRKSGDREKLDQWFARLQRLSEAALRRNDDESSQVLLRDVQHRIASRKTKP